ncbi:MAG: thioesterase family protein [Acidimicrobiales bacterium]
MSTSTYQFDVETAVGAGEQPDDRSPVRFDTTISARWNIGDNPNGGYLAASSLRAMAELAGHPDPLSVTTHYLRPGTGDEPGEIHGRLIRLGRRATTTSAELHQAGTQRLQTVAAFGDLGDPDRADDEPASTSPSLSLAPVPLPEPDSCVDRRALAQGVELPILDRLDVRIDPRWSVAGAADRAEVSGWIRFADGRPPDSKSLVLFADAFPPSVFSLLGTIGWVPTLELTVHVRRRPAPGWIRARFTTNDLSNGMLIENGQLWDSTGRLVAQSRQLALLLV